MSHGQSAKRSLTFAEAESFSNLGSYGVPMTLSVFFQSRYQFAEELAAILRGSAELLYPRTMT